MDSDSPHKLYDEQDFDLQQFLNTFCTPHVDRQMFEEIVRFPLKTLATFIKPGKIFADFTFGPNVFHLHSISDIFSEIIILEPNQYSLKEMQKWQNKEEGCLDCARSLTFLQDLSISDIIDEKDKQLRLKISNIVNFDFRKEDPTEPFVMPKVDSLLDGYILQHVSRDKEDYYRKMKKLASVIKEEGTMALVGTFGTKNFSIAGTKFHLLNYDEKILREALNEAGMKIVELKTMESQKNKEVRPYETVFVAIATKEKEI